MNCGIEIGVGSNKNVRQPSVATHLPGRQTAVSSKTSSWPSDSRQQRNIFQAVRQELRSQNGAKRSSRIQQPAGCKQDQREPNGVPESSSMQVPNRSKGNQTEFSNPCRLQTGAKGTKRSSRIQHAVCVCTK